MMLMRRSPTEVAQTIVDALPARPRPLVVAIDGRSGSGKSTTAAAVRDHLARNEATTATVLEGDTFYAGGSAATWDRRPVGQSVDAAFDWRSQQRVLRALRGGNRASWAAFDWRSTAWDTDDPEFEDEPQVAEPALILILEGVYSARPEHSGLVDMRILIATDDDTRRQQLAEREGSGIRHGWEARWAAAEDHYFTHVMPADSFDLVVRHGPA